MQSFQVPSTNFMGEFSRDEYPNPATKGSAAGFEVAQMAVKELNERGVEYGTDRALDALRPQVLTRLTPGRGGVLICVATQKWQRPDPTGAVAQSFVGAYICGDGVSRAEALKRYFSTDRLGPGASEGWSLNRTFVWATLPAG